MAKNPHKHSYTIPCSSAFRDSINTLAESLHSNVADLARSILLIIPEEEISRFPDPGGPQPEDRVLIKSGADAGKTWRRKPRLQVRLREGYDASIVRRALNVALKIKTGNLELSLNKLNVSNPNRSYTDLAEEVEILKNIVSELAFDPLPREISNIQEALHILGFYPTEQPDKDAIRMRFRKLATIHHPDGICGSHQRMTQINAAMELLCK